MSLKGGNAAPSRLSPGTRKAQWHSPCGVADTLVRSLPSTGGLMTPGIRSLLFLVSAGLVGCKQSQPDLAAEKESLLHADREWSSAAATPNVDSVLSFWSDDAIVIPPGQPPVV